MLVSQPSIKHAQSLELYGIVSIKHHEDAFYILSRKLGATITNDIHDHPYLQ